MKKQKNEENTNWKKLLSSLVFCALDVIYVFFAWSSCACRNVWDQLTQDIREPRAEFVLGGIGAVAHADL